MNASLVFPYHLASKAELVCRMTFPIKPNSTLSAEQVKDRIVGRQKDKKLKARIGIECSGPRGKSQLIYSEKTLSTENFIEMYLARLRGLGAL